VHGGLSQSLFTGPAHHRSIAKKAIADDPDLCLPHLHSTPPLRGSRRTIAMAFDMEKLEWFGYPMLKKNIALSGTVCELFDVQYNRDLEKFH